MTPSGPWTSADSQPQSVLVGGVSASLPNLYVVLSGRIDACTSRPDGVIAITDIKTARILPTETELADQPSSTMYHLLGRSCLPDAPAIEIVQFHVPTGHVVRVRLTRDQVDQGKAVIRNMVAAMDGETFEARVNPACGGCAIFDTCPAVTGFDLPADEPTK